MVIRSQQELSSSVLVHLQERDSEKQMLYMKLVCLGAVIPVSLLLPFREVLTGRVQVSTAPIFTVQSILYM